MKHQRARSGNVFWEQLSLRSRHSNPKLTSTHISRLPYELLFDIFDRFSKKDLKLIRLVCHYWSDVAIPLLYNRIYVSSRPQDVAVFRQWMSNDLYRNAVRELIIDFLTIDPSLSMAKFVEYALPSLVWNPRSTADNYEKISGERGDKLLGYIAKEEGHPFDVETSGAAIAYNRLIKRFKGEKIDYELLVRAYHTYRELADQQRDLEISGEYERLLTHGFSQLDDSIKVGASRHYRHLTDYWPGPRKEEGIRVCPSGPPFLRSWPFNLASLVDEWLALDLFGKPLTQYHESDQQIYPLIARACSLSGRTPRELTVRDC